MLLRNIALNPLDPANTPQPQFVGLASKFRLANLNVTAVPEAGTSAMLGLGLLGVALAARRQSRKA